MSCILDRLPTIIITKNVLNVEQQLVTKGFASCANGKNPEYLSVGSVEN